MTLSRNELRRRAETIVSEHWAFGGKTAGGETLISAITAALSQVVEDCARVADEYTSESFAHMSSQKDKLIAVSHIQGISTAIRRLASGEGEKER